MCEEKCYMILYKFYDTVWKPYFQGNTYSKEEAEELYKHTLHCYPNGQWMLIKIEKHHLKDTK